MDGNISAEAIDNAASDIQHTKTICLFLPFSLLLYIPFLSLGPFLNASTMNGDDRR